MKHRPSPPTGPCRWSAIVACASLLVASPVAHAAPVTYHYVQVGYVLGFGFTDAMGSEEFSQSSSNLPFSLGGGGMEYSVGASANPGNLLSGAWSRSDGTNGLTGTLEATNTQQDYAGTPFTRTIGQSAITGGQGYFAGATGTGSVERLLYHFDTGSVDSFAYHGLEISRMSVTVESDAPIAQYDTRGVSVVVGSGTGIAGMGTYTPLGSLLPQAISFTYSTDPSVPQTQGSFAFVAAGGTLTGWQFTVDSVTNDFSTVFTKLTGLTAVTDGAGLFAGQRNGGDFETYLVEVPGGYAGITVNRVAAVPEPHTYALLLAGLGLLGATAARRKARAG